MVENLNSSVKLLSDIMELASRVRYIMDDARSFRGFKDYTDSQKRRVLEINYPPNVIDFLPFARQNMKYFDSKLRSIEDKLQKRIDKLK